jgi:Leucine-rich repeat (LRR) protein
MTREVVAMSTLSALLIVGLVWAGEAEEKVIAAITKLQGQISRDEDKAGQPVVYVKLQGTKVTDAGLKDLAALKQLRNLDLNSTKVTDAGLKDLAALKQLETLDLDNTKVTDAGLKDLAALKELQILTLNGTKVTDAGLKDLAALKQLDALDLRHTKVTDIGVKDLKRALPECSILR